MEITRRIRSGLTVRCATVPEVECCHVGMAEVCVRRRLSVQQTFWSTDRPVRSVDTPPRRRAQQARLLSALDAKVSRTERRFPDTEHRCGCRTGGGRRRGRRSRWSCLRIGGERHRRDEVQATVRLIVAGVDLINRHFGEVVAVAKYAIGIQTQFLGDSRDPAGRKTEGKARPRQK